ncbi:MAG: S1 RNA-binding domain-containing protein [Acholeplasmataceae bacterium]|nr:S1 RNA-binding domain-containing protein [Acholeplasmataceae bacterium]
MELKLLKVGSIVEGTVIQIEQNTIYLDIQDRTEGKIHLDNYDRPAPDTFIGLIKIGQRVKARVQKITDEPAQILLSRLPLLIEEKFEKIQKLAETGETVKAKVRQVLDKGLVLSYMDNEVFLPYSLLDYDLVKDKETLKGKTLEIQIIEATEKGRSKRIVGSRKQIFEKERQEAYEQRIQARQGELEQINTGDVVKGIVDKIEAHAATIRFTHVVGLLRISQVSHYRIEKIEDVLTLGQEVEVKVIKKEGNRLDLSMKALQKTPYEQFYEEHKIGSEVTGTVFQKLPFGIIVEVAKDVRGLLHKNEFSWNPNDNFENNVKIGDEVTLTIIQLDPKKERIALSKKSKEDNPWKNVTVKRGEIVKVPVLSVSKDGIKVEVQGVEGEIPFNELSNEKIGKAEDYFAAGDTVQAIVIEVNKDQWNLKLSIRRVLEKAERATFEQYLEDEKEDNSGTTIGDLFEKELTKTKKTKK